MDEKILENKNELAAIYQRITQKISDVIDTGQTFKTVLALFGYNDIKNMIS